MVGIDFYKFKELSGYDIEAFFTRFDAFISNNYQRVIDYYNGGDLDNDSFYELDSLIKESKIIEPLFRINMERFETIDSWELIDLFSEAQIKLETAKQTGKWLRSSRMNVNETGTKIDKIQRQNETIENIAAEIGYSDPQNDWVKIALDNSKIEEEYTMDGGAVFTVILQNNVSIGLSNIVDYNVGKNVLGKDVNKKISFVNNDLDVVWFEDALNQSFGIKMNVYKNSIPEFPDYGYDSSLIGSNVAAISYPSLFRDLLSLFKQDERWSEVNLIDIFRKDSSVVMKFEAKSILKDRLVTNINI